MKKKIADRFLSSSPSLLWIFFFFLCLSPSNISALQNYSVAHPTTLRLSSALPVKNSPGFKPGVMMACERVQILGLPRLQNLGRYANSLKVKINTTKSSIRASQQNVEVCFHRNASLGIGMCPQDEWKKLNKGSWVRSMSPYNNVLLDLRMPGASLESIEVSTEEVFLLHRVILLILGILLMTLAPVLSKSVVFYYGSAMAVGIILVILMVLFQGMKLLPTGRKSSLAIFLYSSTVGVGSFLLSYLSGLMRSLLVQLGLSEDIYSPVAILLLVCLVLAGAWLGFWGVQKFVLTEDGSVDVSVAQFFGWSIRIFAAAMILQSSLDTLLATEALLFGVVISAIFRRIGKTRLLRCLSRRSFRIAKSIRRIEFQSPVHEDSDLDYMREIRRSKYELPKPRATTSPLASCSSILRSKKMSPHSPSDMDTYYSAFHKTPERKKFSKEEWERFTRESTKTALEDLVSSPDFSRWAVANAERITLTPTDERRNRRWFHWF